MADTKEVGVPLKNVSTMNQTCGLVDTSAANPFFIAGYSVMFVVGLFLNGYTMNFYFCQPQQKLSSSLMVYLKNLTAADFLLCLSMPFFMTKYSGSSVIIQKLFCSFGAPAFMLNMYASVLFMGYIAANRYLKIIRPLGTHILQTVRAAHIISIITWVCVLAPTVTSIILFIITRKPQTNDPNLCGSPLNASVKLYFRIIYTTFIIIFVFVLVSLIFFYCSISRRVSLAQQSQVSSSGSKKLVKSRRNILVLVSVFCVCFVPVYLVPLPFTFVKESCSVHKVLACVMEVTTMVSALNVCLDPLVYFFLCKAFRTQVRTSSRRLQINGQLAKRERETSREQQEATEKCHINSESNQ